MRQWLVGKDQAWRRPFGRTWARSLSAVALGACALTAVGVAGGALSGCAVSESDAHRWETTENGPEKLYAVVTHDKYSWPLREEAAMSLVRMKPRNGKRVGLEYLVIGFDTSLGRVQGALAVLGEDARRRIVDGLAPKLLEAMQQPPPPRPPEGGTITPDGSIPFKDAAYALISHEPPLASNEATKAALVAELARWVQADFESRIDNATQQFGVEQIMRFLGASSVKSLPSQITESSSKVDRACSLVADIGDDDTKKRASDSLVALAKHYDSTEWVEKQRAAALEADAKAKITVKPEQVNEQLKLYQEQQLEKVFVDMKRIGGRPVVDYLLGFARDANKSEKGRMIALAALENRVEKNVPSDVNLIFDIVKEDKNPDGVRALAMSRLGELPKEMIVPKLYALFDKKWQIRLEAAKMILKTMTTKDLPDFMQHLPQNEKTKMGLSEPLTYGSIIMEMDPKSPPKPRDELLALMPSGLSAKLIAAGSYYQGKKSEAGAIKALEEDKTLVPKCVEPADACGWSCDVPKAPGSQEKDTKAVTTVGEFVRWCVEPSLQGG
jgi:hypothetical protein